MWAKCASVCATRVLSCKWVLWKLYATNVVDMQWDFILKRSAREIGGSTDPWGKSRKRPSQSLFSLPFPCLLWLWRSSLTSEFSPEFSRDNRVKNNLHFDNIRKAELHLSVTAALTSRTCCCFVITRKPQSFRLMTENPLGVSEILQYSSSPPLTKYTWLIDLYQWF